MKLKRNFKEIWQNEKLKFSIIFLLLGIASYLVSNSEKSERSQIKEEPIQLDTMIPEGFVLLPLDLVNRDALSSIVGATAVIDLFTVNSQTLNPSKKIASRIKIIRTPRNPEQFALLIHESETNQILNFTGPYFAVIQNKSRKDSQLVKPTTKRDVQISYQE